MKIKEFNSALVQQGFVLEENGSLTGEIDGIKIMVRGRHDSFDDVHNFSIYYDDEPEINLSESIAEKLDKTLNSELHKYDSNFHGSVSNDVIVGYIGNKQFLQTLQADAVYDYILFFVSKLKMIVQEINK